MKQRRLGKLEVSAVGLGCMRFSNRPGRDIGSEMQRVFLAAVEGGVTHFDTAASYGWGENERLLGECIATTKTPITIATKCGIVQAADGGHLVDGTPEQVRRSCDESLERLGVERIDLMYQHRVDPDVPIEETVGALGGLVAAGKIAYVGLCEVSAQTLTRAVLVHSVAALQSEWSLWSRELETEILEVARASGVGIVSYSPLGRGFFANEMPRWEDLPASDFRRTNPRFVGKNREHNEEVRTKLSDLASRLDLGIGQLALAWLLSKGEDVAAIPGTTRTDHLLENISAADVVLDPAIVEEIESLIADDQWVGERYPAGSFLLYSDTKPAP
jgi:aryl-alcohol dehydrogenase-like predicted oxidoreductase